MTNPAPQQVDFIIIGFGPTGMVLANLFGKMGYSVAVFEQHTSLPQIPRAIHFDDEAMRLFQHIGLSEPIIKISKSVPGMQLIDRNGKVLLTTKNKQWSGYSASNLFYKHDLETILAKGVDRYPNVHVYWGYEAESISSPKAEKSVHLRYHAKNDGLKRVCHGRYVIGADGANSFVRQELGIALRSLGYRSANLKVDVKLTGNIPMGQWIQKLCEPKLGAYVFLNGIGQYRRWEFALPHRQAKQGSVPDNNFIHQLLERVVPVSKVEIVHAVTYRFFTRIAKVWAKERAFLAGDAAHQMPPYIGQGMCAGFRDARNLAWKIDLVMRNQAHDKILATYQKERAGHVSRVMLLTVLVGLLFSTPLAYVLKVLANIIPGALRIIEVTPLRYFRGFWGRNLRVRGKLFPQSKVQLTSGALVWLDQALGPGFAVLLWQAPVYNAIDEALLPWFKSIGGQWVSLGVEVPTQFSAKKLRNIPEILKVWGKKHRTGFVILRPDRYVYDGGNSKHLMDALNRLRRHLGEPTQ